MVSVRLLFVCWLCSGWRGARAEQYTGRHAASSWHGLGGICRDALPEPVRVGDLLGREVLRPVESQDVLGRVAANSFAAQ